MLLSRPGVDPTIPVDRHADLDQFERVAADFNSVAALTEAIELWASHWNDDPKPFVGHTPAKKIIAKVPRGRAALTHQSKSATYH